jgi:hypothetical protein
MQGQLAKFARRIRELLMAVQPASTAETMQRALLDNVNAMFVS